MLFLLKNSYKYKYKCLEKLSGNEGNQAKIKVKIEQERERRW
ncbi:Uncharacterised protein [Myroides odoratus]|nr:hypothetical protein Myrod_0404 [Myroides odoratus DSM 2801]EKB08532.1 hypothetical protein HMPREF9716_00939 [Myroides odoratus CIP 103059]STZ32280.1 Uncharacterised protein [Myroides odoratus]